MTVESNPPAKKEAGAVEAPPSSGAEVDAFLARVKTITPASSGSGRLIFAMDATMSRHSAVAVYASGGRKALQDYGSATKSDAAARLLKQLS